MNRYKKYRLLLDMFTAVGVLAVAVLLLDYISGLITIFFPSQLFFSDIRDVRTVMMPGFVSAFFILSKCAFGAMIAYLLWIGMQKWQNKTISIDYFFVVIVCGALSIVTGMAMHFARTNTITKSAVDSAFQKIYLQPKGQ